MLCSVIPFSCSELTIVRLPFLRSFYLWKRPHCNLISQLRIERQMKTKCVLFGRYSRQENVFRKTSFYQFWEKPINQVYPASLQCFQSVFPKITWNIFVGWVDEKFFWKSKMSAIKMEFYQSCFQIDSLWTYSPCIFPCFVIYNYKKHYHHNCCWKRQRLP